MKPLYDVNAAAQLLAVSCWTIRAYIRQGKLRPVRVGRLVRLEEDELQRFVAEAKSSGNGAGNQTEEE
jgi:excisionase family DNA binding protein